MKKYILITIASLALFAASCEQEPKIAYKSDELGAVSSDIKLPSFESGDTLIAVYSNAEYNIVSGNGDHSWITFPSSSKNDEGFRVEYEMNDSYPRSAMLILFNSRCRDTVYVRQPGQQNAYLSIPNSGVSPKGSEASEVVVALSTNIDRSELSISTVFDTNDKDWLQNISVNKNSELCFDVSANPDTVIRKAQIELSFVDGANTRFVTTCYVTQMTSDDRIGQEVSFEEVRALGKADPGYKIEKDIVITGVIISDVNSKNMGENPRNTMTYIDYSMCEKTAFIQSEDGKYGFKLITTSVENNVFKRYDKVKLNLKGTTITKYDDPEYYDISDVTSFMLVSSEAGKASDLPEKLMYISDLKDNDIYTYVHLRDCELPVRKGSMTPINEGYSVASNAARSTKYPLLMRDIKGDDMYILTNTTCPYRRNGERLPYGSGTMGGIIVHELHTSFNYLDNESGDEDTYGNIGRYQIRHVSKADFGMDPDFKNSFSALLTEYRFIKNDYASMATPTYGTNGYLTHSFKYDASSSHGAGNTAIIGAEEFSYLGPIGNSTKYLFGYNVGNKNGLGIIIDNNDEFPDGYDWGNAGQGDAFVNINKSEAGKGKTPTACKAAMRCWYNWDSANNRPYSWILNFSTTGIVTDQLSLQIGMLNSQSNQYYGPRFWQIQWGTTGRDSYDSEWTTILDQFIVPDTVNWTPATQLWQSPGYKTINVRLPLEMLDLPAVYIRIRPTCALCGNYTNFATDPLSSQKMMPSSQINYIGVRYNKSAN